MNILCIKLQIMTTRTMTMKAYLAKIKSISGSLLQSTITFVNQSWLPGFLMGYPIQQITSLSWLLFKIDKLQLLLMTRGQDYLFMIKDSSKCE